jgi:DNA (cytosine-5)-methyltransferase 1
LYYVLDMFSGIGGFSLGLERSGMQSVAFCEIDDGCRAVLKRHWPNVALWRDVGALRGVSVPRLVCGRPPSRAEWEAERASLNPDWVVVENVAHTWRRWVPELRRQFHGLGYASVPFRMRASNVGAWHERARIFVVAHADSELLRQLSRWWDGTGREVAAQLAQSQDFAPARLGADDGLPDWVDRRKQLGNAVVPQIAELIGRGICAIGAS